MTGIISLSIAFSSEAKKLQLDYISGRRIDMSEINSLLLRLQHIDLLVLRDDTLKKAFWINIYNGVSNYIVISKRVKRNIVCNLHLFTMFKVQIGDYRWSLNQIEHGVLRHNSVPLFHFRRMFSRTDARIKHIVSRKDERIHFALNFGGRSCPSMRFYSPQTLEQDLEMATHQFVENNVFVDDNKKQINCSQIFKWYHKDFEGKYIYQAKYKGYEISFNRYDWSLDNRNVLMPQI